ncbi:MAG: biopolymer transporter ExbD, partial [Muribaculaceae bacterium]|nr:biopolymer transporter ExbD [Muribaculaceae bacterium]
MVDMNMLLITFFMLCTTMLKSQTLSLVIPAKSENQEQQEEAKQSEAVTIIIDGEAAFNDRGEYISDADKTKFYVYEGMLDDNVEIKEAELNGKDESTIRNIIFRKNQKAYEKIEEEIAKKDKGEGIYQNEATRDSLFNEKVKEIGNNEDLKQATVM